VFDNPSFQLRDDLPAEAVPGWDSLNHFNLIVGVEAAFGVEFTPEEIAGVGSAGDIVTILARHGISDIAV
jgi:acyl carrier protein